jgi:hypothetical protein
VASGWCRVARKGDPAHSGSVEQGRSISGMGCLVAPPTPRVFVSVASKEVRFPVTPLDATLVGWFVSAAFKGVRQGIFCLDMDAGGGRQTGRKERK